MITDTAHEEVPEVESMSQGADKKKSVAVITYHRQDNYGAMLQCYALQQSLKKLGTEAVLIDYSCKVYEKPLSGDALRTRGLLPCLISTVGAMTRLPRKKNFTIFRDKLSKTKMVDHRNVSELGDCFDYYLTGSDIVWNHTFTGLDHNYFLEFVSDPQKRRSYAASFGSDDIPQERTREYQSLLSGMHTLLVREASGVSLIKRLTDRDAAAVLDPTLLLSAEDWLDMEIPVKTPEKYVLAYHLKPSRAFFLAAKKAAETLGCSLVFVPFPMGGISFRSYLTAGPSEWLYLIRNAEYVITDSFHACVFSILFHKPFAALISQFSTRIENIANLLHLQSRIVPPGGALPFDAIDYEQVDALLQEARAASVAQLKRALDMEE